MATSAQGAREQKQRQPRHLLIVAGVCIALCIAASTLAVAFVAPSNSSHGAATGSLVTRRAVEQLEKPQQESGSRQAGEYRLGLGKAIDVLRHDMVELFGKGFHEPDFSIYSDTITVLDARAPDFQLHGLDSYRRIMSTIQWSIDKACDDRTHLEITSLSPPVNNEVYVRWRLQLWPRDVLAPAKGFLSPLGDANPLKFVGSSIGLPFTVEGYSKYEFDPWTAAITKHTLDITNPPMYIMDLIRQYVQMPSWGVAPVANAPSMYPRSYMESESTSTAQVLKIGTFSKASAFAGKSAPKTQSPTSQVKRAAVARNAFAFGLSLPQSCEDDFECNDGKANFPLQCCELPMLGNFCCEPDDFRPEPSNPAYVPLPVPVNDGQMGQMGQQGQSRGGYR